MHYLPASAKEYRRKRKEKRGTRSAQLRIGQIIIDGHNRWTECEMDRAHKMDRGRTRKSNSKEAGLPKNYRKPRTLVNLRSNIMSVGESSVGQTVHHPSILPTNQLIVFLVCQLIFDKLRIKMSDFKLSIKITFYFCFKVI